MATKDRLDTFFLPNFCSVRSILLIAIAAELIAFVLILATGDILSESWDELGLLSLFVQWMALGSAALLCAARPFLSRLSLFWSALGAYIIILLAAASFSFLAQYFLMSIDYQWGSTPETIGQFVVRCTLITAIIALVALRYFYVLQQWKARIELESQARVDALQSRIRPHFLFNSMNIIASLIRSYPQQAEQAVEDLSELFRATLRDTGSMVPVKEEWRLCENYLRIEGLRLGERLSVKVDLSHVPNDAAIPMLTLQPLVENAIYHGIQALETGGTVEIKGQLRDNMVNIQIINPVPSFNLRKPSRGNKIAVLNITHRLHLIFGNQADLTAQEEDGLYVVTVVFPYVASD